MTSIQIPLLSAALLVTAPAMARAQDPLRDDTLAQAAAEVRVGDADAALATLRGLEGRPPTGDELTVERILWARAWLLAGEPGRAEASLGPLVESSEPVLAPVVDRLCLDAAVAAPASDLRRADRIVRATNRLLARSDIDPTLRVEARYRLAVLELDDADRRAGAIETLWTLADEPDVRSVRPKALEQLVLSEAVALDRRAAARRRLLLEHGETAEGRRALDGFELDDLSTGDRLARARHLYVGRAYELAEIDFEALLAARGVSDTVAQEAHLRLGIIRIRMREGYDRAVVHLRAARNGPNRGHTNNAWFRLGVAQGQLARWQPAVTAMRTYLQRSPRGDFWLNAAYQVPRLLHQAGRYDEAVPEHEALLGRRRLRDRVKWVWFLGWTYFRADDCPAARAVWSDLVDSKNPLVGAKALYWTARCHHREGDPSAAQATLAELAQRAPLGYYGLLGADFAHREFGEIHHSPYPPRPDGFTEAAQVAAVRPALAPFEVLLDGHPDAAVLREIRLLVGAGYPRFARRAAEKLTYDDVAMTRLGEGGATELRRVLDLWLELWGPRWRAHRLRSMPWKEGIGHLDPKVAVEVLPPAYLRLARAAGRPHDVSPWWLLAHMLQESRYTERARSHVGALGPMQVLPRTGRRIAVRLGYPRGDFFEDRLFEPGVGLRHAAWYLDALRREFEGNVVMAIAAYNGGPLRVAEHLANHPSLPFDVMVEEIGAHETRNYARKVSDHIVRYASIYADDAERAALLDALRPPKQLPRGRGETRF